MSITRIWKLVKATGKRIGVRAFRHGCGRELLKRTGGSACSASAPATQQYSAQ